MDLGRQRDYRCDGYDGPRTEVVTPCKNLLPTNQREPTVALLPWGNVLEDYIDSIGISLEVFCEKFSGSYMFGYIDALRRVGVRTVLICISARVDKPSRFTHLPTGATICVLPAPWIYRAVRGKMCNPYGRTVRQMFGAIHGVRWLLFPVLVLLRETALYLTTPLQRLAHELRREHCDAILCQEYEYPRFDVCVLLGRLMHLPVFATFQGGDYQRSRLEPLLRRLALQACAGLIIATKTEILRVRARYGTPPTKLAQIFNPIDPAVWSPVDRSKVRAQLGIPHAARVVVWHGRVSIRQKGLDILLEAWKLVCNRCTATELRLLLIGTGQDSEELSRRIALLQSNNLLWVNEFVQDRAVLRDYLSAADVYVFPSRHEGFPVAPIEAMACGLPVVAANTQGIPDIFYGGEQSGGLIVQPDNPVSLAEGLERVLTNPTWSRELGKRARRRVESSFSLEAAGAQMRSFLFAGQLEVA